MAKDVLDEIDEIANTIDDAKNKKAINTLSAIAYRLLTKYATACVGNKRKDAEILKLEEKYKNLVNSL